MSLPIYATSLGGILVLLGVGAYFVAGGPGEASVTALIPAFLGGLILIAGLVGRKERFAKHGVLAAFLLAVLGLLGTAPGLVDTVNMLIGETVDRPMAAVVQAITALLCIGFVLRCIQWYMHKPDETPNATPESDG